MCRTAARSRMGARGGRRRPCAMRPPQEKFNGDGRHNAGVIFDGREADVDLDCQEALATAGYFLPATDCIFGRESARAAHWIYATNAAEIVGKATLEFLDPEPPKGPDGKPTSPMLLELRCGGGGKAAQTVFPGSVHESGEPILFEPDRDGDPAEVDGAELIAACKKVAAASLVARAWPSAGGHQWARVVGGFLARAGLDEPSVGLFLQAVLAHVGGPNAKDHVRTGRDAAKAHADGRSAYGFPQLKEMIGERRAKRIAEWLNYDARAEVRHHDHADAGVAPQPAPAGGAPVAV